MIYAKFWSSVYHLIKVCLIWSPLAVQTVERDEDESLLGYYGSITALNSDKLIEASRYVGADVYFSRKPFVDQLLDSGFERVSRLRTDAYLRYLYTAPKEKRRGASRKYDGRVGTRKLRPDVFTPCCKADDGSWSRDTTVSWFFMVFKA